MILCSERARVRQAQGQGVPFKVFFLGGGGPGGGERTEKGPGQGRALYGPIPVETETFEELSGPLVHTNSWGNSYGPMVLKVLQKFPPTLALVHGWLFPAGDEEMNLSQECSDHEAMQHRFMVVRKPPPKKRENYFERREGSRQSAPVS